MTQHADKSEVYERLSDQQVQLERLQRAFERLDEKLDQLETQMIEQGWMERETEAPRKPR